MQRYIFHNHLKYFYLRCIKGINTPDEFIRFFVQRHAHKTVIECGGQALTMEQLNQRVNRLANNLMKLGLHKGDKIGLFLKNSIEFIELRLAAYKSGFVFCALIDDFSTEQILQKITEMKFSTFFCDDIALIETIQKLPEKQIPHYIVSLQSIEMSENTFVYESLINTGNSNEPMCSIDPDDISAIGFTSGTTGESKGVVWNHRAWLQSFYHFLLNTELVKGEMRMLQFVPLSTAGSLSILPWLASGGKMIVKKAYSAKEISECIDREKITHMATAPVFLIDLWDYYLENRDTCNFSSLTSITVGSAPLAGSKLKQIIDTFGPIIQQSYGMAEVLAPLASLRIKDTENEKDILTSVGVPIKQVDIKLFERNEQNFGKIKIASKTACLGYWTSDGIDRSCFVQKWFITDDLGSFDIKRNLFVRERKSRCFEHNEHLILPRDIEEIIHGFPGIKDVVVNKSGNEILAHLSVCRNYTIDFKKLKEHCLQHLAGSQIPDAFIQKKELPVSASGKILSIQE